MIVTKMLPANQIEVVQAEIDRQHIVRSLVRVAVGNSKSNADYDCMIIKAQGDYGIPCQHGLIYRAISGAWEMLWAAVYVTYEYFRDWNRR